MSRKRNPANGPAAPLKPANRSMDDEAPKTLNAAVDTAGKVHGSLTELETLIVSLKEHLGALTTHLKAALPAMKAGPIPEVVVSEPEPVVETVPAPVPVPEPVVEEPAAEPGQARDASGRFSAAPADPEPVVEPEIHWPTRP